ncbi:MAG: restriction endonuclease subunit S [Marinifilaceae bacterium]
MREDSIVQDISLLKQIPFNWKVVDFSFVLKDCSGGNKKVPKSDYLNIGKYPIIDQGKKYIAGFSDIYADLVKYDPPYIVFGDHTRVLKYIDFPFIMGADGVKVLKIKTSVDLKYRYLFYYLNSISIPNTGYNRHYKYLKEIKIPLPPLEEQKKIAAILDNADKIRQINKDLIKKYDELSQSLFIDMFGDPVNNPMGWDIVTIRDLISEAKYGTSSKAVENGKYTYLRMNNITYNGYMNYSNLKYIDVSDAEKHKYIVKKGDILFNRTNSKELVGKTGIISIDKEMIIAGYLIRVRTNEFANPYYIWAHLNSKWGKLILNNMCKSIVGMANINAQELQNIKILKAPIELQEEFAKRIKEIEKQKAIAEESLSKSEDLFNALMQKAFKGKLTQA